MSLKINTIKNKYLNEDLEKLELGGKDEKNLSESFLNENVEKNRSYTPNKMEKLNIKRLRKM
jgi:hypothetical protein